MWRQLLPALYTFKLDISVRDEISESDHSAILPHEVFHSLYTFAPEIFRKIMGTPEDLLEFWDAASEVGDDWYRRHPVVGRVEPMLRVPFGFHGDDAGVHGQEQVLVITWGSVALKQCTFDSRIVFTMLRVASILDSATTMHTVYRVLQWSFKALSDGKFPDADHNGKLFSKAHHKHRFLMAGKDLAGGMCGAFAEMRGDWKYLKEALHLQQYYGSRDLICHRCNVLKFSADLGMRYTALASGRTTSQDYLQEFHMDGDDVGSGSCKPLAAYSWLSRDTNLLRYSSLLGAGNLSGRCPKLHERNVRKKPVLAWHHSG
jgi:hypothetical protein